MPKKLPGPPELVSEWSFSLPENKSAFLLYIGNAIPGYTGLTISYPAESKNAIFVRSHTGVMASIGKAETARQVKITAFNYPQQGQPIQRLRFSVRSAATDEWIITVVREDMRKESVCNLLITSTGTFKTDPMPQ